MIKLPIITDCSAKTCAFNHDGCAAPATTMGADGCATFIQLDVKGGVQDATAQVGTCQRTDCAHNDHLECSAGQVEVGADGAQCLTFTAA
ncbi:hypothetical protein BSR29_03500 [Boudabousia liubingyangii]|uniref:DUF1540 domain-containing protein n=1 Tax=Boudabousia liubingyangii TaxID=1921764 RepID=A0A1Q5PN27_9ACTO|nr:DUF1540 domain-containing protein [Boudabousia liubingyangii]OKL47497.1 hypothetical protein BSR28_03075 [Boudabousia liubingyangii]OKL48919.1 hypothetical protein BSR29_03500 [Boudabousia liubingyangii]